MWSENLRPTMFHEMWCYCNTVLGMTLKETEEIIRVDSEELNLLLVGSRAPNVRVFDRLNSLLSICQDVSIFYNLAPARVVLSDTTWNKLMEKLTALRIDSNGIINFLTMKQEDN